MRLIIQSLIFTRLRKLNEKAPLLHWISSHCSTKRACIMSGRVQQHHYKLRNKKSRESRSPTGFSTLWKKRKSCNDGICPVLYHLYRAKPIVCVSLLWFHPFWHTHNPRKRAIYVERFRVIVGMKLFRSFSPHSATVFFFSANSNAPALLPSSEETAKRESLGWLTPNRTKVVEDSDLAVVSGKVAG